MKKSKTDQPEFDLFGEEPLIGESSAPLTRRPDGLVGSTPTSSADDNDDDVSHWQEVPAARFLSWTSAEQFLYCAKRDYDSAGNAEDLEWAEFYLTRATHYEALKKEHARSAR